MVKTARNLEINQHRAMRLTLHLGRRLQEDFPQIADLYQNELLSQSEIVDKLRIDDTYGVEYGTAIRAVSLALRGFKGSCKVDGFEGLLTEDELEDLLKDHQELNGEIMGERMYEERKGIHAWSSKKVRANAKKASLYGVKARNQEPWTEKERRIAYRLSKRPAYQHRQGLPNLKRIQEEMQARDYPSRTTKALAEVIRLMRAENN